jgi:hypothetical protein
MSAMQHTQQHDHVNGLVSNCASSRNGLGQHREPLLSVSGHMC